MFSTFLSASYLELQPASEELRDEYATLLTVSGRVEVDFVPGEYQLSYLEDEDYENPMGTFHYRPNTDAFYLHVVIQKEVDKRDGDRVLGIDVNLKNKDRIKVFNPFLGF
ncbi:hypothetical protein C5B91_20295 [Haloferax sp. Atlit-10N]|uniref:hypothetical protein n=1 Tax=unclassified Haloferax TaxID=2625095 RepID=UPI000E269C95|nr:MULTISPECIES: hypothetical protein [unclassified Haloferax]RDZ39587.1 hypothetical protein C5B87_19060 [Haloferax sp. Atlit-16N]RDZ53754.1 hypothetical protein C5B91_20295 [Haloferax sp. Atlit-10N]